MSNNFLFPFTEEHEMIRQAARDFAQRDLIQDVIERDNKGIYPARHIETMKHVQVMFDIFHPEF